MAIDDLHPEYKARSPQWEKCRDATEGQEAVHAKGAAYLPKLSGQSDAEYDAYKGRALFYGATPRTVDGLSGMVFRKPPTVEVPAGMKNMVENITLDGLDLTGFAEDVIDDNITVGRAGILVDHPAMNAGTTVAQAEALNLRPFLKLYAAESIFNWKVESRNNARVLTQLRLWEIAEKRGANEFDVDAQKQIRILDLNDVGQYRQRVFVKVANATTGKEEWVQDGPDIIPMKGGKPLDRIPFWFVGVKNGSAEACKPPLIDLVNANLSHYKSTADLEHGAHFTGLPTAVITGFVDTAEKPAEYRIGSATAWIFPDAETEVKYLEFEGQGLEALEKRLTKKEEYMAFLGARMLTPEKKQVEAVETAQIHRTGEISVLASLTIATSKAIESALKFAAEWANIPGEIKFALNVDFLAVKMSAQELTALLQTWQAGGMAFSDFLANLKKGEIIDEDRTEDDIRSEIETADPFMGQDKPDPTADPNNPDPNPA